MKEYDIGVIPGDGTEKRGQIYLFVLLGLPCPRNSTRLATFFSISSANLELPVNCPRCNA